MQSKAEKILSDALALPEQERATMASRLLESIDITAGADEASVQAAWASEIDRRKKDLSSGAVKPMSAEESVRVVASDDPADDAR
jgi:putative addiction module component (TIGR02574 family)